MESARKRYTKQIEMRMKSREGASCRSGSKLNWKLLRNSHFGPQLVTYEPRTVFQRESEGRGHKMRSFKK